jgi:hypothetical protein
MSNAQLDIYLEQIRQLSDLVTIRGDFYVFHGLRGEALSRRGWEPEKKADRGWLSLLCSDLRGIAQVKFGSFLPQSRFHSKTIEAFIEIVKDKHATAKG